MCGITGFIAFDGKFQTLKTIQIMTDLIKHRGPDDEGYYAITSDDKDIILFGDDTPNSLKANFNFLDINQQLETKIKFALGHRRLSIVDLSDLGHQPLAIDNDNYWICFNGEVYNHIEIKQELLELGYKFKSKSDTEVILSAYKEWGSNCLSKLNGMFAFIIYDKQLHKTFIARDRFGVKPLYYYLNDTGIYFASEIKQFTVIPGWSAKLNHKRACDFLVYGLTDHTSDTMFANVYQIRGGECAEIDLNEIESPDLSSYFHDKVSWNGKLPIKRWYDLPNENFAGSYQDACQEFQQKFIDSVKLRLRSDVDVGSCLSGGLDSSSIVSAMQNELKSQNSTNSIKTFSACSHYKEFDEKEYVDIVVAKTDSQAYYTYPELNELFAQNDKITWHQDEPFGSTSIYAQWEVFKLAKIQNVKVMLDGQGADEQLCGYKGLYIQTYFNELFRRYKLFTLYKEIKLFHQIHGIDKKEAWMQVFAMCSGKLKKSIKMLLAKLPIVMQYKILGKKINSEDAIAWLNENVLHFRRLGMDSRLRGNDKVGGNENPFIINGINRADIKKTSYSQLMMTNLSMLLHWEDRDSMAHSIESRVPFLDYKLVELIYSLPTKYKISDGIMKRVLRDGLDGILPDEIKNRQTKLGFVTPEEIWMKDNADIFKEKLIMAVNLSNGVLNMDEVLNKFDKIISGQSTFDFWVWRIISFGSWMKTFNVSVL